MNIRLLKLGGYICVDTLAPWYYDQYLENSYSLTCDCSISLACDQFDFRQYAHNKRDGVSNHQPRNCLLNDLLRLREKKSKLRVTGRCGGNSPLTGEFPAQRGSNAENVSIWWRHHVFLTIGGNNSTACSSACLGYEQIKQHHSVTCESPHKGPVKQIAFSCHVHTW